MSTSIDWSWAFYTIAGVLACAALWLGWRALFHDRARGRKRCPKCWYDLSGLMAIDGPEAPARESLIPSNAPSELPRCPECGHVARKAKQLGRTRRRWKLALLALVLMLLSAASALTPKVQRDGWASLIPLRALVWLNAREMTRSTAVRHELWFRASDANTPHAVVAEILEADPSLILGNARTKWPEGMSVWLPRTVAWTWGDEPLARINGASELKPSGEDSFERSWNDGLCEVEGGRTSLFVPFATRAPESADLSLAELIRTRAVVSIPIRRAKSVDEILEPLNVSDSEMRDCLRPSLSELSTGKHALFVHDLERRIAPDVTAGMHAEFLDGARVIARAQWWQSNRDVMMRGMYLVPIAITGDLTAPLADPTNPRFTVRFTGDGEMALRDFDATKYWKGSFTIPFSDLIPKR